MSKLWSKKKLLPTFKKSLRDFLTDESWKITKKDALWLSAAWAFLALWEQAAAAHVSWPWHRSWSTTSGSSRANWSLNSTAICNHASWVVNGHFSNSPTGTASISGSVTASHNSHSSHSSGGWC